MAFRNKAHLISPYKPDILVVPECENPGKLKYKDTQCPPRHCAWFGTNPNKGIGIFSYTNFQFKVSDSYNENFKLVVPLFASDGQSEITVFAIWANNPGDRDGQYVTQVWKALTYYAPLLDAEKIILAGDFNSNSIWDRPSRTGNHTDVVSKLAEKNIFSTYHQHFRYPQGKEQHPTHYLYRHENKPFHLDYCFVSANMLKHLKTVEIGDFAYWSKFSDHVPVISTFSKRGIKQA